MPITDMQPAEKVWGNFGCIRINCRTLCLVQQLLHNSSIDNICSAPRKLGNSAKFLNDSLGLQ